jgi:WD40 repeat protein
MVAVSRELHILNVTNDSHLDAKTLLKLRGHEGKILAIDKLNTRIVGSCSSQDLKIWDLYKEKEQYSLHKSEGLTDLKFIPGEKRLALGALDWSYKFYDVESMKMLKAYKLRGIPLTSSLIDINTMLVGGFPNVLTILDLRMPDPVYCEIGEEAITCLNIGQ